MANNARLKEHYTKTVKPKLKEQFGYKNDLAVPRLDKIVVNVGMGREAVIDGRRIAGCVKEIALITGQKPVVTKAKTSIASFKTREGQNLGVKVTLRAARMYEFLDRLVNVAMPRIRDFRGISPKSFDGRGNYAMGIKEQIIFPEINFDDVENVRGMDIIICTTAKTDKEARALLDGFNLPFTDR
jgi:large subunit ribosomal protein L5